MKDFSRGSFADAHIFLAGQYVSAADAPFSQRSLPPSSLDTADNESKYPYDYHIYIVNVSFTVIGGPIAPWFDQPGLGAQYFLGAAETINSLKGKKYLVDWNWRGLRLARVLVAVAGYSGSQIGNSRNDLASSECLSKARTE